MSRQAKPGPKEVPFTPEEYSRFKQRVFQNSSDFKRVLSLSITQKKVADIKKLIRSYADVFYQKGLKINIIDDRFHEAETGMEYVLTIEPLVVVTYEGRVINLHNHYIRIRQEMISGKPVVLVEFYLNTLSKQEVQKMDEVLSLLAKILYKKGFKVHGPEHLVRFELPKKRK